MKVLLIETEILLREKLLKLISAERSQRNISNYSPTVALHDSPYTTEELLKELDVSNEMIEEVMQTDVNKLLIIVNDEVRINQQEFQLISTQEEFKCLEYKNFKIHLEQEQVYISNKRIKLTQMEYKLLLFFIYNAKKLITRQEIIEHLWDKGERQLSSEVTMYTHIKNLRRKLLKSGVGDFIHTMYNQGYKFEDPAEVLL